MDAEQRWATLPDEAKTRVLEKYRNWSVEGIDWWDGVYESFREDMEDVGIDVDRMYFTGFWSQGDGACFEGAVEDWGLFLPTLGYTDATLVQHAKEHWTFGVVHSGRYYHENCTSFKMGLDLPNDEYMTEAEFLAWYGTGDDLRDAVLIAVLSQYDGDKLEKEFTDAFKDHMKELYRRLEEEYEYLTSDESVLESLIVNDRLDDAIDEVMEYEND